MQTQIQDYSTEIAETQQEIRSTSFQDKTFFLGVVAMLVISGAVGFIGYTYGVHVGRSQQSDVSKQDVPQQVVTSSPTLDSVQVSPQPTTVSSNLTKDWVKYADESSGLSFRYDPNLKLGVGDFKSIYGGKQVALHLEHESGAGVGLVWLAEENTTNTSFAEYVKQNAGTTGEAFNKKIGIFEGVWGQYPEVRGKHDFTPARLEFYFPYKGQLHMLRFELAENMGAFEPGQGWQAPELEKKRFEALIESIQIK